MDIFASFATDEKLELEGAWFSLSKTAKVKVARAGNSAFAKKLRDKLDNLQLDLNDKSEETNELAEKALVEVMADTILMDWKGVEFRGKPMEYSKFNARLALGVKDFRAKISKFSDSFEAFKVKDEEEAGNDSAISSPGN